MYLVSDDDSSSYLELEACSRELGRDVHIDLVNTVDHDRLAARGRLYLAVHAVLCLFIEAALGRSSLGHSWRWVAVRRHLFSLLPVFIWYSGITQGEDIVSFRCVTLYLN